MIRSCFARVAVVVLCIGLGLPTAAQTPRTPAISQDDLRTWLTYLSSDELQGRQVHLLSVHDVDGALEAGIGRAGIAEGVT